MKSNHRNRVDPRLGRAALIALAAALACAAMPAPRAAASDGGAGRGRLVSATPVERLAPRGVRRAIAEIGISPTRVADPIVAYRLVYSTVQPSGLPTTASGLLVLPHDGAPRLRTIAFEHGTTITRHEAPSTGSDADGRLVAMFDASAGFAAIAPDYLGTGVGPGKEDYLQLRTEVSASVDMIRAARTFAADLGRRLDPRVLVSGFSQGGGAALALGHALGEGRSGLRLGGLAAVSGVYDLQHVEIPALLSGKLAPAFANFNLTEFALAWRRLYGVFGKDGQIFQPNAERLTGLFDGHHSEGQALGAMPATLAAMFRPGFLARLAAPQGPLLRALRANDTACKWRPRVPVALFYSPADEVVAPANTQACAGELRARGGAAKTLSVGPVPHLASIGVAAARILDWLAGRR